MEKLRLTVEVDAQNTATAALEAVGASLRALVADAKRAGDAIRGSIDPAMARLEALGDAARKMATAMSSVTDGVVVDFGRMRSAVVGDLDAVKAGTKGAFSGLASGARAETDAAVGSTARMRAAIVGDIDSIKATSAGMFAPMADAAATATDAVVTSISRAEAAIGAALTRIRAMASESAALAGGEDAGMGLLGRTRRGRGGLHFGRLGSKLPGGTDISLSGTPALSALGILGYGVYSAAKAQDDAARIGITAGIVGQGKSIIEMLKAGAGATGFGVDDVGEAYLGAIRETQGLDNSKQTSMFNSLLPYAASEARLKKTSLRESMESIVSLSHMAGIYEPAQLAELAKQFSFYSLSTTASLPSFAKTLSYSMPVLRSGMGMDPNTIMALTALSQNAGINNTKSGTWIRSFFQGAEPSTGKNAGAHNDALRQLGLLDSSGAVTWRKAGADGKTDWTASTIAIGDAVKEGLANAPIDQRLDTIKKAFGERGGGIASLMSTDQFLQMLPEMGEKLKNYKGGQDAIEEYTNNSTVQQARETWRDTQNVLIDIGQNALPAVNSALRDFDEIVKTIGGALNGSLSWKAVGKLFYDKAVAPDVQPLVNMLTGAGAGPGSRPQTHEEIARALQHGAGKPLPSLDTAGALSGASSDLRRSMGFMPQFDPANAIRGAIEELDLLQQKERDSVWTFGELDTATGLVKASFTDLGSRSRDIVSGLHAFAAAVYAATARLVSLAGFGGSGGDGGTGSDAAGGVVNASYETGGRTSAESTGAGSGSGSGSSGNSDAVSIAEGLYGVNGRRAAAALRSQMTPGEWCADFVNGVLKASGGMGVNSSMAAAFKNWGRAVGIGSVARGDVILERHGSRIGHVGLATGLVRRDKAGHVTAVQMISGNYGHAVRKNWELPGIIAGLRRGSPSETARDVHRHAAPPAETPSTERHGMTSADAGMVIHAPVTIRIDGSYHDPHHLARVISREIERTVMARAHDVDHDV